MATARVLLDTDVLIDHLRGARQVPVETGGYSSLTRAELYSGREADERLIDLLLSAFDEVPVDREIAEAAGRIRRTRSIALPDAIVAATAMVGKRSLLTHNVRHFRGVRGLRLSPGSGKRV